jgi:trimeric autotransporter adhesin
LNLDEDIAMVAFQKNHWTLLSALACIALLAQGCAGEDTGVDGPVSSTIDASADAGTGTTVDAASSGGTSSGGTSSGGTSSGGTSSGGVDPADAGSSEDTNPANALPDIVALTLQPAVATIPVGASLALELTGKLSDGTTVALNDIAKWSSSNPDAISVSNGGLALGIAPGSATVTASVGSTFATAQVAVSAKTVSALEVTPKDANIKIGSTVALSAIATMNDGSKETVTDSVAWSTAEKGIVTVDNKGVATGVAAGATDITATLGKHAVTANVTVKGALLTSLAVEPVDPTLTIGESVKFTATAAYEDGQIADVTNAAKWSSSAADTVGVSDKGVATALKSGSSTVSAEFGGQSDSRVVTVATVQLSSLTVSPVTATVAAGGKHTFTVVGAMNDGTKKDFTSSVVWSVNPTTLAVISNAPGSHGEATGLAAGDAVVTAKFNGIEGTAKLVVTAATLKSIAITGATGLAKGVQKQLKALGTYSDGKALDITAKVTWQSSNEKLLTVSNASPKGWLAAIGEGNGSITASLNGVTGKVDFVVSAAALIKILVAPTTLTIESGLKEKLTAKAQYSDGSVVEVTAQVVWSSTNPSVAAVSNAKGTEGLVSALKAGNVTVKAALGSNAGSAAVTVKQPELIELTIGPHNVSRKAGQYVQYWAIAVYSNKQTQNVTKQATWSTSSAATATIQQTGNFKGVAQAKKAGEATITAKYAGKTASTKLTVTNPTLVEVQVSPAAWSTPVGIPMQFQAVALFSDDSSQNITWQASWTSSKTAVAQVGNSGGGGGGGGFGGGGANKGRIQALSPGDTQIQATYKGITGKAALTVTPAKMTGLQVFPGNQSMPAGDWRKFEASLLWSDGKSTAVTNFVSWTSSNSAVAAALNGNGQKGLVQSLKPGTSTITAAGMGFKASGTVTVTDAKVTSLQLSPALASVAKGVPVKYNAVIVFSDGTSQNVAWQTTFSSSDPSVASVSNANGAFKGIAQTLKAGTTTIKATAKGVSATATLTVKPAELKELQVSPTNPKIAVASWAKMDVVAVFTDDTTQQVTSLATWTSSNKAIAAISNFNQPLGKGFVQALKSGTSTISAFWGGKTGSTTLTVQQAALVEIQVTPFAPKIPVGYGSQFVATGIFADNTTQHLTGQVSWTSTNTKVATVTSTFGQKGRVTPLASGTAEIVATFGGKQGKTKLTVTGAALKSISIVPATLTMALQSQTQLKAEGSFADGTKFNLTNHVLWKSDKPGIAPVSNAAGSRGLVSAIGKGAAKISAVEGKVVGTASVVVN